MGNLLEVKDKVQRYLSEIVGRYEVSSDGNYSFRVGSSRVFIRLIELEKICVCLVQAPVLVQVPLSAELYKHIALHTDDYIFGHLSLSVKDGEALLLFSHTLLADYLDLEELGTAVGAVASVADEIDDQLQQQFGGSRFHDDD